jgi:hypothetical protein
MRVQRQPKRTGSTRLTRPPRPARQTAATNRRRARAHPPRNANFSRAAAGLVPRAASANRPRHRAQRTSPTPSAGRAASRLTTPTRLKTRWNSLSQKAARSHVRTHARAAGRQAGGRAACLPGYVPAQRPISGQAHQPLEKLELELPRLLCSVLAAATGKVGTSVREAERDVRGRAHGRWRELKATCVRVELLGLLGLPRCGTRARPAAGGPAAAA